jgi:hypothetical protein
VQGAEKHVQCPVHNVNEHYEGVDGISTAQSPQLIFHYVIDVLGPAVLRNGQKLHVFTHSQYCICVHTNP